MNRSPDTSFADPELVELFGDEPELLAVADAVRATTPAAPARTRRISLRPSLVAGAVLVAAAAAIVLAAPWQRSHGTLADQALAAIGSGQVVHVVSETATEDGLVDLGTGKARPRVQRDEIWYDASRGLRRDLTTVDSRVVDDDLETPQGEFVPGGRVYDCTWIAAHPVAATRARVSCNASGDNGKTPHVVPRPKPTLDPGLAGFADGYRAALASGEAREAGAGVVDGRKVDWLVFSTSDGGSEKVALDQASHKPILLQTDGSTTRIVDIDTIPYDASDFPRPQADEVPARPSSGRAEDISSLALDGSAIAVAYPGAVWAGAGVAGLPLVEATTQKLTASYAGDAPSRTGLGLDLVYGTLDDGHLDYSQPYVEIQEAPSWWLGVSVGAPQPIVRDGAPPAAGTLYVDPLPGTPLTSDTLSIGATVAGALYVTIETDTTPATVIEVGRALTGAG